MFNYFHTVLLLTTFINAYTTCMAKTITSTRIGTTVEISRIVELIKLTERPDIQINIIVRDFGGTGRITPRQELFLTLYRKGEKFSTDATFNLGLIYDFKSATKIADGYYEIVIGGIDYQTSRPKNKLFFINAQKAINDILKVKCEHLSCPASDEFKSIITMDE